MDEERDYFQRDIISKLLQIVNRLDACKEGIISDIEAYLKKLYKGRVYDIPYNDLYKDLEATQHEIEDIYTKVSHNSVFLTNPELYFNEPEDE